MSNIRQILEQVAKGELSVEEANNALEKQTSRSKSFRITDRGAVALLGVQRRSIVLFPAQWRKLNNQLPYLLQFINKNQDEIQQKQNAYVATQGDKDINTDDVEILQLTETSENTVTSTITTTNKTQTQTSASTQDQKQIQGKTPGKSPGKTPGKTPGKSPGKTPGKSPGKSQGKSLRGTREVKIVEAVVRDEAVQNVEVESVGQDANSADANGGVDMDEEHN